MWKWIMAWVLLGSSVAWAGPTPGETYMAYQKALANAQQFGQVLPFFAQSAKDRLMRKGKDAQLRQQLFESLRLLRLTEVTIIDETIDGQQATVVAEGNGTGVKETDQGRSHRTRATVTLVLEKGHWQIVKEEHKLL